MQKSKKLIRSGHGLTIKELEERYEMSVIAMSDLEMEACKKEPCRDDEIDPYDDGIGVTVP